jgi:hypothetical protein
VGLSVGETPFDDAGAEVGVFTPGAVGLLGALDFGDGDVVSFEDVGVEVGLAPPGAVGVIGEVVGLTVSAEGLLELLDLGAEVGAEVGAVGITTGDGVPGSLPASNISESIPVHMFPDGSCTPSTSNAMKYVFRSDISIVPISVTTTVPPGSTV